MELSPVPHRSSLRRLGRYGLTVLASTALALLVVLVLVPGALSGGRGL